MSLPPTNAAPATALHEPQNLCSKLQHFHGCMKTWPEFLSAKITNPTLKYEGLGEGYHELDCKKQQQITNQLQKTKLEH